MLKVRLLGALLFLVNCGPIFSRDVSQPISDLMWKSPSGKYSLLISTGEVGSDGNATGCVILLHQTEGLKPLSKLSIPSLGIDASDIRWMPGADILIIADRNAAGASPKISAYQIDPHGSFVEMPPTEAIKAEGFKLAQEAQAKREKDRRDLVAGLLSQADAFFLAGRFDLALKRATKALDTQPGNQEAEQKIAEYKIVRSAWAEVAGLHVRELHKNSSSFAGSTWNPPRPSLEQMQKVHEAYQTYLKSVRQTMGLESNSQP